MDKKIKVVVEKTVEKTSWLGLLGIVLVVFKLLEIGVVATWSWWLVLLPFYLGLAIVLGFIALFALGVGLLFAAGAALVDMVNKWKRKQKMKGNNNE